MLRLGTICLLIGCFSGVIWGIARALAPSDENESAWQREYGGESESLGRALFILLVPLGLLIILLSFWLD